jgi:hypothetical protein
MSTTFGIFQSNLRIMHRGTNADPWSIVPKINFMFDLTHTAPSGASSSNLAVNQISIELWCRDERSTYFFVGRLFPVVDAIWVLPSGGTIGWAGYLILDYYSLGQIERIRGSKDLQLQVRGSIIAEIQQQPQTKTAMGFQFDFRVAKSDWVENILSTVGYKRVTLLEIPELPDSEFGDIVNHINAAWKQYAMGEYSNVLTECRKALETLTGKMKAKGFERETTDNEGTKKRIPDWDKLLGSSELGDILGTVNQKVLGFVAPSAHAGTAINKEEADFGLMVTHSLLNMAIHKLSIQP